MVFAGPEECFFALFYLQAFGINVAVVHHGDGFFWEIIAYHGNEVYVFCEVGCGKASIGVSMASKATVPTTNKLMVLFFKKRAKL